MSPVLATLVYTSGIAVLFFLDRDNSIQTSKALWLPVIYLWILGSRPISVWFGIVPAQGTDIQLEGSPIDAVFFGVLLIAAIVVLIQRGRKTIILLNGNLPILMYFSFCLLTVIWSDFPGVAIKRWIKALGDLAMILIVVTDEHPLAALRRLFSRTSFILLPISLLLIKYYPSLGRSYDIWSGAQFATGATLDKNMLGVITFVLLLGATWRALGLFRLEEAGSHRFRHLLAQVILLAIGVSLLVDANSVTSSVSFSLGVGLLLATGLRIIRRNPSTVHVLVLLLVVVAISIKFFGVGARAAEALGRNATLTGRTDIWAAVIPMVPHPLVGAGFESFWLSPSVRRTLTDMFQGLPLNEAHDGYIEVYLNLGVIGLGLLGLILIDGYRRAVKAFRYQPALGGLLLAYVLAAITYSITEAGFRMMHPNWIFLLLAVTEAGWVVTRTSRSVDASPDCPPELTPGRPLEARTNRRRMIGQYDVARDKLPLL